jgi:hypothetical protein
MKRQIELAYSMLAKAESTFPYHSMPSLQQPPPMTTDIGRVVRRAAATTVAVVEVLPFVGSTFAESLVCVAFPAIGSVIAAAASISKARCEVDAAAATAAATQLSSRDVDMSSFNPGRNTLQLVQLTVRSLRKEFREIMRTPGTAMSRFVAALRWLLERAGVPVKRWDADARGGPAPA